MKLKDYKRHTFKVCMAWRFNMGSALALERMVRCLERWDRSDDKAEPYDYHGDVGMIVHYCSDRMNPGRAKAILRLLNEHKQCQSSSTC